MIELQDFTIGYKHRLLLSDVTAVIPSGQLTALIGRNGSGKSTLLRAIAALGHNHTGQILLDGNPVGELSASQLARTIALVTTERIRIPNLSCEDVVAIGRAPYTNWMGHLQSTDLEAVSNALDAMRMTDYAHRPMETLSDGECQRIMIARALAQDTPILLLDEPTSFLDLPSRYELCQLLSQIAHTQKKTILFSTHELDLALKHCDNIALMSQGGLSLLPLLSSPALTVEEILSKF